MERAQVKSAVKGGEQMLQGVEHGPSFQQAHRERADCRIRRRVEGRGPPDDDDLDVIVEIKDELVELEFFESAHNGAREMPLDKGGTPRCDVR